MRRLRRYWIARIRNKLILIVMLMLIVIKRRIIIISSYDCIVFILINVFIYELINDNKI